MREAREMHVKEHVGKAYHRRSSEHSWINEMQDAQIDEIPHARNPLHYNAQWVHRWDVFPHAPTQLTIQVQLHRLVLQLRVIINFFIF
jgi:hypothetical protein